MDNFEWTDEKVLEFTLLRIERYLEFWGHRFKKEEWQVENEKISLENFKKENKDASQDR